MQRKVNRVGEGTLTVSLPKLWVKQNKLSKGQTLNLKLDSNKLILSVNPIDQKESKHIILNDKFFMRRLIALEYVGGLDELSITYDSPTIFTKINEELRFLPGWEIMHQTTNSCKLKILLDPKQQDLDKIINRLFLVVISFTDELVNAIINEETEKLTTIRETEGTITRLTYLCLRILNKKLYVDNKLTNTYFAVVTFLENIGDTIKYLCDLIVANGLKKFSSNVLNDLEKLVNLEKFVYKEYHKPDIKNILAVRKEAYASRQKLNQSVKKKSIEDVLMLEYISRILKDLDHINILFLQRSTPKQLFETHKKEK